MKCLVCRKQVTDPRRRRVCSPVCAATRLKQQLTQHNANRRRRAKVVMTQCEACRNVFKQLVHNHRYCDNAACKAEGLRRAVEQQKARRRQNRKLATL